MYIADLLKRFESEEELPQSGPMRSSKDTVSFQAHREKEKLNDLGHLEELKKLVKKAKSNKDIISLAGIVCYLYKNTGSKDIRELYVELCKKDKLGSHCIMYLIDYANRAKLEEILPFVRQWMNISGRTDYHYSEAVKFLSTVLGRDALEELGNHLNNDCFGRADPIFCIDALEKIGDPAAIPYFENFIERHKNGKKGWEQDGVYFCLKAIGKLKELSNKAVDPTATHVTPPASSLR